MDTDINLLKKTLKCSRLDLPQRRRLTVQQLEQLGQLGLSCHLLELRLSGLRPRPLHPDSSEKW